MITKDQLISYRRTSHDLFRKAEIFITEEERSRIEIADFGLGEFETTGLGVLVYVNTDRCCAKELAMLPHQTCPEHLHPPVGTSPGKEETFRCRWGKVFLYVDGEATASPRCQPPVGSENAYTVRREIELNQGEQYTIFPGTKHWFQSGDEGAVVSEFSTRSTDENDLFTDQRIARFTKIVDS